MKVSELILRLEAKNLTPELNTEKTVSCGYCCDLLSWVMSHGEEGMAWVTVQTHMNVVAVAVLAEMACIILPESIQMDGDSLQKAIDEDMCVLSSPLTSYEICGRMAALGIQAHN